MFVCLLKMLPHFGKKNRIDRFMSHLPVGGSGEHHCEPGHPSEGLCVQKLQLFAWGALSLPGGLPAPALAGHPCHVSSSWVLPGVQLGE